MDRDPNLKVNNKFIEWLSANGVWVKQESAWGRAPHPLVISSSTEDDGESCGRGLLARDGMSEGELMMTIPLDLCLTRGPIITHLLLIPFLISTSLRIAVSQRVFGKTIIPDLTDEYIAIALLLMHEKLKGAESLWKPYFDILPKPEDVYPSFIWSEEELDMLKGSPTYYASKSLRSLFNLMLLYLYITFHHVLKIAEQSWRRNIACWLSECSFQVRRRSPLRSTAWSSSSGPSSCSSAGRPDSPPSLLERSWPWCPMRI